MRTIKEDQERIKEVITLRVTAEEKKILKEKSKENRRSLSSYVINQALK